MLKSAARVDVSEPAISSDKAEAITRLRMLPSSNTVRLFGTPNLNGINRKPNETWIPAAIKHDSPNAVAGQHLLHRRLPAYFDRPGCPPRRLAGSRKSDRRALRGRAIHERHPPEFSAGRGGGRHR